LKIAIRVAVLFTIPLQIDTWLLPIKIIIGSNQVYNNFLCSYPARIATQEC
jgi:hypothetical protein